MPRTLFTDGFNSLAHVGAGAAGAAVPPLLLLFIGYQVAQGGENTLVDIFEGLFGAFLWTAWAA